MVVLENRSGDHQAAIEDGGIPSATILPVPSLDNSPDAYTETPAQHIGVNPRSREIVTRHGLHAAWLAIGEDVA
jgi:hypothetical protein